MANRKLIDFAQLRHFLIKKGEWIFLPLSCCIFLVLVTLGIIANNNAIDWGERLRPPFTKPLPGPRPGAAEEALANIRKQLVPVEWQLQAASAVPEQVAWTVHEDELDTLRRNPYALPVQPREVQIDYVAGVRYVYEVDLAKGTAVVPAGVANVEPLRTVRPMRLLVCSAAFPFREQLEVFQKALRIADLKDLLKNKPDMPKFLGLAVTRVELSVDGKVSDNTEILKFDAEAGRCIPSPSLDTFQRESLHESVPAELRKFVRSGLVMPLPALALGTYPRLNLPTIKAEAIEPALLPPQGMGGPAPKSVPFDVLPKVFQQKFMGKNPPFEVGGEDVPDKILVRFCDTDVKPGRTYQYRIEVVMQNPNFGKQETVVDRRLASVQSFRSPPVLTTMFTIPQESHYYGFDQWLLGRASSNFVPVQIHRWIEKTEAGAVVGDWAVAERVLIRRGETIGRRNMMVEVPEWNDDKERFEVRKSFPVGAVREEPGTKVDLRVGDPDPILVDFTGGNRMDYRDDVLKVNLRDEAVFEMLVLDPTGKLMVQPATDTDEGTRRERERWLRHKHWQDRLRKAG